MNHLFIIAGEPSDDPTHVDYIPCVFAFTSSPQKTLFTQALRHKCVSDMKQRRLEFQSRSNEVPNIQSLSAEMPTTEQLSDVMALPLVNLTNASKHVCEFTQDFTKEEVILKKELEDEQIEKEKLQKVR